MTSPKSIQHQQSSGQSSVMGSPRDGGKQSYFEGRPPVLDTDCAQLVNSSEASIVVSPEASADATLKRGRNHKRGSSYFDGWVESMSKMRLTPPGTPKDVFGNKPRSDWVVKDDDDTERESSRQGLGIGGVEVRGSALMRYNSFPFATSTTPNAPISSMPNARDQTSLLGVRGGDLDASMASTPSATSASSPSQSPSSPPHHLPHLPINNLNVSKSIHGAEPEGGPRTMLDSSHYNFFLDRLVAPSFPYYLPYSSPRHEQILFLYRWRWRSASHPFGQRR